MRSQFPPPVSFGPRSRPLHTLLPVLNLSLDSPTGCAAAHTRSAVQPTYHRSRFSHFPIQLNIARGAAPPPPNFVLWMSFIFIFVCFCTWNWVSPKLKWTKPGGVLVLGTLDPGRHLPPSQLQSSSRAPVYSCNHTQDATLVFLAFASKWHARPSSIPPPH